MAIACMAINAFADAGTGGEATRCTFEDAGCDETVKLKL